MKNIYIVQFITGESLYRSSINVVSFLSKEDALSYVNKCNDYLKSNKMYYGEVVSNNSIYKNFENEYVGTLSVYAGTGGFFKYDVVALDNIFA